MRYTCVISIFVMVMAMCLSLLTGMLVFSIISMMAGFIFGFTVRQIEWKK